MMQQQCTHYRRRCSLVAPCCDRTFRCRHCHDEESACDEKLDRKAVTEVACDACGLRQPVALQCSDASCAVVFGHYACLECRFFDDEVAHAEKKYFHCDKCGICRVGGRENWVHCDKCGSCVLPDHGPCIERNMHNDCAICRDDLFTSVAPVAILHCGHAIHRECLDEMIKHSQMPIARCPTCCKTISKPGPDREALWAHVKSAIDETPMPPETIRPVAAQCNDCGTKFEASFHVFGCYACPNPFCLGYNSSMV